jgi:outer membrane protein OmpA-like peptidoglycan-associated protein
MSYHAIKQKANILLIFAAALILYSCSVKPIEQNKFTGYSQIERGESAKLSWDFNNAEKVNIHGFPKDFHGKDSVIVTPEESTTYKFTASSSSDSLILRSIVNVTQPEKNEITRGPELENHGLQPSYKETDYLNGILDAGKVTLPHKLKVVRTMYPYKENSVLVRALILDQFGNFLTGFSDLPEEAQFLANIKCGAVATNHEINTLVEKKYDESQHCDYAVVMDNSLAAIHSQTIFEDLEGFVSDLAVEDNLMLAYFNQDYHELIKMNSAKVVFDNFNSFSLPEQSGLNALYKSAYKGLNSLIKSKNPHKALILITSNADNASIIYSANDPAALALEYDIPIYIIGVGFSVESFILKYMCALTGGYYYSVSEFNTEKISGIMKEISFSQKFYYEFEIPMLTDQDDCNKLTGNVTFQSEKVTLEEKIRIVAHPETQPMVYQAIASFDYKDTYLRDEFESILVSLAEVLMDNPESKIQLVGHSSIEGNNKVNKDLSERRADVVKKRLIALGAGTDQIKTKAVGASQPIYYLQTSPWQQQYNRRVEVRWLDPSILPYEIVADVSDTEDDAMTMVEEWEDRGYRVYYDRYLKNYSPNYRVKLWGYSTEDEAVSTAKKLGKKYKKEFVVE